MNWQEIWIGKPLLKLVNKKHRKNRVAIEYDNGTSLLWERNGTPGEVTGDTMIAY